MQPREPTPQNQWVQDLVVFLLQLTCVSIYRTGELFVGLFKRK